MPELPDLEVFKTNIFNRLTSKQLVGVCVWNHQKVNVPQGIVEGGLVGRSLAKIDRVGKELIFDFGESQTVSAHLMLNGEVSIVEERAVDGIRFKIFSFRFGAETLVFSDKGGLCTIKYLPKPSKVPDAFDDAFTLDYFLATAKKKALTNIKAFLIDQSIVKGIGNAYADEILWEARVSPSSLVGKIPNEILEKLYRSIGTVLHAAVESIQRLAPAIISGEERSFLKVHTKLRKETETGFPIQVARVVSKITYFTEEQILY